MSEEDARRLNLDQLWLDPSIFNEDIAFDASAESRHQDWQQSDVRCEQGSSKAAGLDAPTPGPANSSITLTEIPVGAIAHRSS